MAEIAPIEEIHGAYRVSPVVHEDQRGRFLETYREEWFPGLPTMVQANRGDRIAGTVVGLHHHLYQADYWYVPFGTARVVLYDIRDGSPTEGCSWTTDLGAQPGRCETRDPSHGTLLWSGSAAPVSPYPVLRRRGGDHLQ